jgi:pilus assembly protein CpaD
MTRDQDATAARRRVRSSLVRGVLLAGCAGLLAGCYAHSSNDISAYAPVDYRQRHPIVVKEREHTLELFVGNSRGGLTRDQRVDVLAFAKAWKREATGGIIIDVPTNTRNAAAANGVVQEVQSLLAAGGVPPHGIVRRAYQVPNASRLATVRVNYSRMGAEAGPCGLWPADIGPTTKAYRRNQPYWNLGCASQRNLAAMVANPADLVQPRGEGAVYQMRRTYVLEQYRASNQTSSKAPPNDAAKISDVGK